MSPETIVVALLLGSVAALPAHYMVVVWQERPVRTAAAVALMVAVGFVLGTKSATAAPQGFYEARVLEPAASYVAGKPATVYCANDDAAWTRFLGSRYGAANVDGVTVPGANESRVSANVCGWLRTRLRLPAAANGLAFVGSALTLVHEATHETGAVEEGATECAAMHRLPGVLVRFFNARPGKQLRALMALAWRWHRLKPSAFQSVC